jgi:hypothetical protein
MSSATDQTVSGQLASSTARVRSKIRSRGICGGQSGTGAGFLRVLRFSQPIFIPSAAPHTLLIPSYNAKYPRLVGSIGVEPRKQSHSWFRAPF